MGLSECMASIIAISLCLYSTRSQSSLAVFSSRAIFLLFFRCCFVFDESATMFHMFPCVGVYTIHNKTNANVNNANKAPN